MTKTIITLAFCMLLNACHDNPTSATTSPQLYPLAIGNYWKYQLPTAPVNQPMPVTEFIDRDTIFGGQHWFRIRSDSLSQGGWFSNRSDGLILYSSDSSSPLLVYKYPIHTNDKFFAFSSNDTVTVVDDHRHITTKAGDFDCLVYQRRSFIGGLSQVNYDDLYVAIGVGRVREEIYYYDSLMVRHSLGNADLIEYAVK